mgnify:CR=1 FL=1
MSYELNYEFSERYFDRFIEKQDSKKYKEIVGKRGNNLNLSKYSKTDFENIKGHTYIGSIKMTDIYTDQFITLNKHT